MKHFCLIIISMYIGLGVFAQSYTLDSSFQPYFDIRNQRNVQVEDLLELPSSNIIVSGNFRIAIGPNQTRDGLLSARRTGSLNTSYTGSSNGGGELFFLWDDVFISTPSSTSGQVDTNGNEFNRPWFLNYIRTVSCRNGIPYFFSDGSSLFANGRDNAGLPCKIINAPDTFPGRLIVKVDSLGLYDSTFTHDADSGAPRGFFPYDSSRILVYGFQDSFSHYDGVPINALCRIFLDGSLDTTFTSPLKDTSEATLRHIAYPALVHNDGRFMLKGRFFIKGSNQLHTLARFHPDGSLDSSFDFRNQAIDTTSLNLAVVLTTVMTEDRGYLVGGNFNKFQGYVKRSIAKLDSNGRVEPQYFTSLGPDSSYFFGNLLAPINIIKKSKFGGYYVGGEFLKWDGQPSQPIIRIHGLQNGVGLDEEGSSRTSELSIRLYPNPTKGELNIKSETEIVTLLIYNALGQLQIESEPNAKNIQLELPNRKGLFYLQMQDSKGNRITKKVIKE